MQYKLNDINPLKSVKKPEGLKIQVLHEILTFH